MKYIVIEIKLKGMTKECPVIFPNDLIHADVANAILSDLPIGSKAIAAGTCLVTAHCSGESETLGLKSRGKEDQHLIHLVDYGGGIKCE